MLFPIIGNIAIAKAFKRKIIPMHMNKSFGFAFINGEIAAMAVAPHIAVPDAIRIDNLVSILKILEIRIPIAKTKITKIEMNGKYVAVRVTTFDADNVNPKITMPIWRSFVPTVLLINPLDDSKNKVKLIPSSKANKGDPKSSAIKASKIPKNKCIMTNAL